MNETKYIVCRADFVGYGMSTSCHIECFDDFIQAVACYTQYCGNMPPSVILADVENHQIIRQFSYVGNGTIPVIS